MAKKYIDADRLRAEMNRIIESDHPLEYNQMEKSAYNSALYDAIDLIKSLQQEKPDDLEKEIDKEWKKCNPIDEGMGVETANIHIEAFDIIARHFYELGQRKAAEMYDEIEYNCQRAEEEMSNKTLDEAAGNFVWEVMENDEEGISDLCRKLRPSSKISDFYDALGEFFKAGAKWMAGQGVTCEGKVFTSAFTSYIKTPGIEELLKDVFPEDTEVIVQIRKKEESK